MSKTFSPKLLWLIAMGCLVAMMGFGVRSVVGLFIEPLTATYAFTKSQLGLAFALQNLLWGLIQPFAGMIADRYGTARTLCLGSLIYASGTALLQSADSAWLLYLSGGILMGTGIAFSSFALVMGAFARLLPKEHRVMGFGLGTASGSAGQLFFAPFGQMLISSYGWQSALLLMASILLLIIPCGLFLKGRNRDMHSSSNELSQDAKLKEVLAAAFGARSYTLLAAGFFVCGFHVAFITVYLPSYIHEQGLAASIGSIALAMIGGFNIIGSLLSGILSSRFSKRYVLVFIYATRALVILAFVSIPVQPWTVIAFSGLMGLLWLSTVPPTNGLVLMMFGPRYLSTLFGFVFLSHQIGSFLGVYIGGLGYEIFGNYDIVWYLGILFGVLSALVHLPIKDEMIQVKPAVA